MGFGIFALPFIIQDWLKELRRLNRDRRARYDTVENMQMSQLPIKRSDGGVIIIDKDRSRHFYFPPTEKWLAKKKETYRDLKWEFGNWYQDYAAPHKTYRYDTNSVCVAIAGVETQELLKLASDYLACVQQNEVLVYDNVSGIGYAVDTLSNYEMNDRRKSFTSR